MKENKKIIFSDNTLWGLINFRGKIIDHFISKGYEVVLVAPQDKNSVMVVPIPNNVRYIPIHLGRSTKNPFTDLSYFISLLKIYHAERPDYIFHYTIKPNIYGILAARILNIRSSAMIAGLGHVFTCKGITNQIAKHLYKAALSYAHKVMILNQENFDYIVSNKICKKEKIIWLKGGEGIDLEYFTPIDNTSDSIIFFMIARVLKDKGYIEFVEAAKKIKIKYPKIKFQLLGPVDEFHPNSISQEHINQDVLAGHIEYLGITNDILSYVNHPGIVVVLPSFYGEGMNRSLMEACALGKPVITTDIAGCRETVDDGENGYIVKPQDVDSLVLAITNYINLSPEKKRKFSEISRKKAESTFDIKNVIKEYEKIIQS